MDNIPCQRCAEKTPKLAGALLFFSFLFMFHFLVGRGGGVAWHQWPSVLSMYAHILRIEVNNMQACISEYGYV